MQHETSGRRTDPDAAGTSPLRPTPGLAAKVLVGVGITALMWALAPTGTERLAAVVVVPAAVIGLVGLHAMPAGTSRLPAAAQGFLAGVSLATLVGAVGAGAASPWLFGWVFALIAAFPAVLPRRVRGPLATRWSDLVVESPRTPDRTSR